MPDYQNSKIFALRSPSVPDEMFIGYTTTRLSTRLANLKSNYKKYENNNDIGQYDPAFEMLKYTDVYIDLIESYPCNSVEELKARTRTIIQNNYQTK